MDYVTEGWENGPNSKRELKEPAKLEKAPVLLAALGLLCAGLFLIWELAGVIGSSLWRLVVRREPKSLKGRVCLVTGSGRGLGRQLCLALAKEGGIIACVDINETTNKQTVAMVKELGAKVMSYTVNIAIKKDVEKVVSQVEKDLGPVYLLINNAAIVAFTYGIDEEHIRATFNTNVFGPTWMMNAVLPTMKMRDEGHIVNIVSVGTMAVVHPLMIYGATKCAFGYISDCIRAELLHANKKNIRVTNVHPSVMNTSEDYISCISQKINFTLEMDDVVKAIMNGIHYNHDEVVVPAFVKYPLILITQLMPASTTLKLLRFITNSVNLPSLQQYKQLPSYDIIKKTSFMETQEKK